MRWTTPGSRTRNILPSFWVVHIPWKLNRDNRERIIKKRTATQSAMFEEWTNQKIMNSKETLFIELICQTSRHAFFFFFERRLIINKMYMQMSHPCNNFTNKRRWIGDYRIGVESTVWSSYQSTWIQWQDVGTLYLASDTSHPFDDDFKLEMRKKEKRHRHTHEAYRPGRLHVEKKLLLWRHFFLSTLNGTFNLDVKL